MTLPDGMVSAEDAAIKAHECVMNGAGQELLGCFAVRDSQWRKALDEARDALGDLAVHDADLSLALAASQARERALREALATQNSHNAAGIVPPPELMHASAILLSAPFDDTALREVCERVGEEVYRCVDQDGDLDETISDIVARVLREVGK